MTKKKAKARETSRRDGGTALMVLNGGKNAERAYDIIAAGLTQAITEGEAAIGVELARQIGIVGGAPTTVANCTFTGPVNK